MNKEIQKNIDNKNAPIKMIDELWDDGKRFFDDLCDEERYELCMLYFVDFDAGDRETFWKYLSMSGYGDRILDYKIRELKPASGDCSVDVGIYLNRSLVEFIRISKSIDLEFEFRRKSLAEETRMQAWSSVPDILEI